MIGTIEVVGGSYVEECCFPHSTVYRGSGVRAANILAGLGNKTTLHTVVSKDLEQEFRTIANNNGIKLNVSVRQSDIWFRYRHPLAQPDIYPPNRMQHINRNGIMRRCGCWYHTSHGPTTQVSKGNAKYNML